jgi:hypothetical protein
MLRIPHFLENRLTDGGEVVSPTNWPSYTPQEDFWYSFLLEGEKTPGPHRKSNQRSSGLLILTFGYKYLVNTTWTSIVQKCGI